MEMSGVELSGGGGRWVEGSEEGGGGGEGRWAGGRCGGWGRGSREREEWAGDIDKERIVVDIQ